MNRIVAIILVFTSAALLRAWPAGADEADAVAEKERFFENRVRPVLAAHCFECHGAKKQQAGLRLDSRAAMLEGGDSGPVITLDKPDESRLVEVLAYEVEDIQMPPKGKLSDKEIAAISTWIRDGAHWPEAKEKPKQPDLGSPDFDFAAARQAHWAFRPVERPDVPNVENPVWTCNPIDAFILRKLEAAGIHPAQSADRGTLLRRATFDLLGLPPAWRDVDAFTSNDRRDAYERLIDELLASPHYGARWGRHWLDVARYADTRGYVFTSEKRYPFSYTYRDYVISAFNSDLPYDRFVLEQLAADALRNESVGKKGGASESLAAMGFLTVGRRFRNTDQDIYDDRIDVVTRGLMGLTVTCARCHDHKYDPIPAADYYSLYGVFASSEEPDQLPLVREPEPTPEYQRFKRELDRRQAEVDAHVDAAVDKLLTDLRTNAGDYLIRVVKDAGRDPADFYQTVSPGETRDDVVARWRRHIELSRRDAAGVFAAWHAFNAFPDNDFKPRAAALIAQHQSAAAAPWFNRAIHEAFAKNPPKSMFEVARVYGELFTEADRRWRELNENSGSDAPPKSLPDASWEQLRQVLYAEGRPTGLTGDEAVRLFNRVDRDKKRKLENKVAQWKIGSPEAPPRAMVLYDRERLYAPYVFLRGKASSRGDSVPRRFPRVLTGGKSESFSHGSGRLDMARAIVNPQNPLTARVLVNRVWMHHFGRGLVTTPSDFGTRSDPPSHPELLDWLAAEFVESGWSIKHLHRLIMTSAVYRQSGVNAAASTAKRVDPQNRLLWRMPRRRLGFEAMRDSLLSASGRIEQRLGGRPVDLLKSPSSGRRTVYGFVDRNNLPGLYRNFNFANPDASTGVRPETTVPQQALFAMNSPFAIEQARGLANHPEVSGRADAALRIREMYRRVFSRDPEDREVQLGLRFVHAQEASSDGRLNAWERYAQVLLSSNEFAFVD